MDSVVSSSSNRMKLEFEKCSSWQHLNISLLVHDLADSTSLFSNISQSTWIGRRINSGNKLWTIIYRYKNLLQSRGGAFIAWHDTSVLCYQYHRIYFNGLFDNPSLFRLTSSIDICFIWFFHFFIFVVQNSARNWKSNAGRHWNAFLG